MDLAALLRAPSPSLDAVRDGPVAVYDGTRDFMRRASRGMSVGKPWGRLGSLPFCFVLVRRA